MFASYFDASGHSEDANCPFVVVAGYVANLNQWKAFEMHWNHVLTEHRITQPFHMAHFMARHKLTSEFHAWDGDDAEAEVLLKELTTLETLFPVAQLSCLVNLTEYREIARLYDIKDTLPPFALGARACIAHLYEKWLDLYQIPANYLECVFEDGDFGKGKFIDVMRGDGMPAPIFKDKKDFAALQAADHLAWEHNNYIKRNDNNLRFTTLGLVPNIAVQFPKANLARLCELRGIPQLY